MKKRIHALTKHAKLRLQQRFGLYTGKDSVEISSVFVKNYISNKYQNKCQMRFGVVSNKPALLIVEPMTQNIITVYTTPTKQNQKAFWEANVKLGMAALAKAA